MTNKPDKKPRVTIYTDGGASPNPGPGGWGAVMIHHATKKQRELSGGETLTTNNSMELTAAIKALEALKTPCEVELYTDSKYLKDGVTKWLPGWIRRGWKRKDGQLKNVELWKQLAELQPIHKIHWNWVRGHTGVELNERADALATAEIQLLAKSAAAEPELEVAGEIKVFLRVAGRGKGGAWIAKILDDQSERTLSGVLHKATSNQLDIAAAQTALEALPRDQPIAIYTGSTYLRLGATQWLPGWKKRNWMNTEGKAVKHADAWQRLEELMKDRVLRWPTPRDAQVLTLEELSTEVRAVLAKG